MHSALANNLSSPVPAPMDCCSIVSNASVVPKNSNDKCQQHRDSVTGHIYESIDEEASSLEKIKTLSPQFIPYDISDEELMMKYTSDISRQSSTTSSGRPLIGRNNSLLGHHHELCNIVLPPSGPRPPPPPPPRDNYPMLFNIIPCDNITHNVYGSMPNIKHQCTNVMSNSNFVDRRGQLPNIVVHHQHSHSTPVDPYRFQNNGPSRYRCADNIINPTTTTNIDDCGVHRNKYSTEC